MNVKEGQIITEGQPLASLDNSAQQTALSEAQAAVAVAQANYDKVLNGSNTPESISASQLLITNAEQNLANLINTQYTAINNIIHTSADQFFTNADSFSPQFGITFVDPSTGSPITLTASDENKNLNLDSERAAIGTTLSAWQTAIAQASSSLDNAEDLASTSQTYLAKIQNFTSDLCFCREFNFAQ